MIFTSLVVDRGDAGSYCSVNYVTLFNHWSCYWHVASMVCVVTCAMVWQISQVDLTASPPLTLNIPYQAFI